MSESTHSLSFSYNHRILGKYIDSRTLDTQIFKITNYQILSCLYLHKTAHIKWQQPKHLDLNNVVNSWIFVSKGSSWKFIIAYPFPIFLRHVIEFFVTFSESRWTDYSRIRFDNFLKGSSEKASDGKSLYPFGCTSGLCLEVRHRDSPPKCQNAQTVFWPDDLI